MRFGTGGAVAIITRASARRHRRSGLVLSVLLAITGGLALATAAGARRTDTAYSRLLKASAAADVGIAPSGAGGRQNVGSLGHYYAALEPLRDVKAVGPQIGIEATVPAQHGLSVLLKASADARLGRIVERPRLVDGRMFDPARANEVVADRTITRRLHLHVGSRVKLALPNGDDLRVRVVGLAVTRDNVIPLNKLATDPAFLASPALLRKVPPDSYIFDAAYIRLRPHESIARFGRRARALLAAHPETGGQLFVVNERRQADRVEAGIRPEAVALALFSALVALTGLLIIRQLFARQIFVASGDHRTLRAIGLTRDQRMLIGLVPTLVTSVIGALGAVVVATAVSPLMPIGPARVAEPHQGFELNGVILGLGALTIVVLLTLVLVPTAWHFANMTETVDAPPGGLQRPSRFLELLSRSSAPATTTIGARLALEPGHGRTAVPTRSTLFGAVVGVVSVVGAVTFGTNLVRLVETPRLYGQTWQASVDLEFDQVSRSTVAKFLRQQPSITAWTLGSHDDASINGHATPAIVVSVGHGPLLFPTLLEGHAPRNEHELVVGSATMARLHRHVGDRVRVQLQGDQSPRTVRIVGRAVFPFFGQGEVTPTGLGEGAALLTRASQHPGGFNFFLVALPPGKHRHQQLVRFARAVKTGQLCPNGCSTVTAQRPADVRNYARVERTPLVLAAVLSLIAFAAVVHLLATSIERRRRDLAILKSIGFQRRQVAATVAWQATVVTMLALIIGLPLGVGTGFAVWSWFANHLGIAPDTTVPLSALLISVPGVLVVTNLVAAPAAIAGARVHPAVALRLE